MPRPPFAPQPLSRRFLAEHGGEGLEAQHRLLRDLLVDASGNVGGAKEAHVAAIAIFARGGTQCRAMKLAVAEQQDIADIELGPRGAAVRLAEFEPGKA